LPLASTTFSVFGSLVAVVPGCQPIGNKTNEVNTTALMIFMKGRLPLSAGVVPILEADCSGF
jgi:hypothetical protein